MDRRNAAINLFRVRVEESSVDAVAAVLRSGYIGEGPVVKRFEEAFREVTGAQSHLAVNSGTSALHLALLLAGVERGDEVITSAQTMMATSHAILMQGAVPVFADVQRDTGNLDPADIARRITPRTKAILPVHWAGYPCDMDEISDMARQHGLVVIEDAAHALGATYRGRQVGSISPLTCFSLQAIKHVTSGDGGMLAVQKEEWRAEGARLRWFGIDRELRVANVLGEPLWDVNRLGFKYHMNDIAAAIGIENLKPWRQVIARRQAIAARYRSALAEVGGVTMLRADSDRQSAHWILTVLVERREDFIRRLVDMNVHPSVVHLRIDRNTLYGGPRRDLPQLEWFTERHVSLPVHEAMSDEDVDYVTAVIREGW
jgi:perosamine synthetase